MTEAAGAMEREGIAQFFQHAHRRAEGHLEDFEEELEKGRVDVGFCDQAVHELRLHLYTEEEILFPRLGGALAEAVADLKEQHGRVSDLIDELEAAAHQNTDTARIRKSLSALNNLIAAHGSTEDLGVYPDLISILGVERSQALLREIDRAQLPTGWKCSARRVDERGR